MGSPSWSIAALQPELVETWHEYRLPILAVLGLLGVAISLILNRRSSPSQTSKAVIAHSKEKVVDNAAATPVKSDEKRAKVATKGPRKVIAGKKPRSNSGSSDSNRIDAVNLQLFFFSLTTTTEKMAQAISSAIASWWESQHEAKLGRPVKLNVHLRDITEIEFDDYFLSMPSSTGGGDDDTPSGKDYYAMIIPSYNIDSVLDAFIEHLKETHNDFRIDTSPLSSILGYTVFGIGDKEGWPTEQDGFCFQAKEIDKWMARLTGRRRAYPLGMGDTKSDVDVRLTEWVAGLQDGLCDIVRDGGLGEGVSGSGEAMESDEEEEEAGGESDAEGEGDDKNSSGAGDVEDLGRMLKQGEKPKPKPQPRAPLVDFTEYDINSGSVGKKTTPNSQVKEMVPKSSPTYNALTKQGYTIVGSHSGVKICRWTKSALRGRGSCYKYSFYGIKSHLCMETTPSLSCSNKCVFCWRHGTNPVGTTWRWQVDPPEMIFAGVKEGHYRKIKMLKGVPGVRAERFEEAMRIRHCALSLVGEPIFYPHINEFTAMLHREHISSFLVCNAQHPDQLAALKPVTQLYVSIDATNKESLKKVDRPLHRDFWERFMRCLDILREKRFRQRTVFRLTLVKGFNVDEVEGYADLVAKGLPCFVEVKGVTYCGTSTSSAAGLTMQNVPFYDEVVSFVTELVAALKRRGLNYGIGAEHAHSCCILLASDRFFIDGKWHTLIDYEKFFKCLESGDEFGPEDYIGAPTPEWAQWGNGGFNPEDERVWRKGKNKGMTASSIAGSVGGPAEVSALPEVEVAN